MGQEPHIGEIRRLNQRKLLIFGNSRRTPRHAGAGLRDVNASQQPSHPSLEAYCPWLTSTLLQSALILGRFC
jgi:hypothetical protein